MEALHHKPASVRAEAARELGRSGQAGALDALVAVVGEQENTVALAAINAIGQIGGDQAVLYLTWALHHKYPAVRIEAASALGRSDHPRALESLIAAIGNEVTGVARKAVSAVGRARDPRAVQPLTTVLSGSEDDSLVNAAAFALREIGEPNCVEAFLQLAGRPGSGAVADENLLFLLKRIASCISHEHLQRVIGLAPGTLTYTETEYGDWDGVYYQFEVKKEKLISFSQAKELAAQELIRREQGARAREPRPTPDEIIRISCAACGAKARISAKYRGRRVKCPKCGKIFVAVP